MRGNSASVRSSVPARNSSKTRSSASCRSAAPPNRPRLAGGRRCETGRAGPARPRSPAVRPSGRAARPPARAMRARPRARLVTLRDRHHARAAASRYLVAPRIGRDRAAPDGRGAAGAPRARASSATLQRSGVPSSRSAGQRASAARRSPWSHSSARGAHESGQPGRARAGAAARLPCSPRPPGGAACPPPDPFRAAIHASITACAASRGGCALSAWRTRTQHQRIAQRCARRAPVLDRAPVARAVHERELGRTRCAARWRAGGPANRARARAARPRAARTPASRAPCSTDSAQTGAARGDRRVELLREEHHERRHHAPALAAHRSLRRRAHPAAARAADGRRWRDTTATRRPRSRGPGGSARTSAVQAPQVFLDERPVLRRVAVAARLQRSRRSRSSWRSSSCGIAPGSGGRMPGRDSRSG